MICATARRHAGQAATALREAGQTVASVEATSGGFLSAALQSVPRASRFFTGGVCIYSAVASKALLPRDVRKQLGTPEHNYASGSNYVESKKTFTLALARHYHQKFGVDWVVAESGAAEAKGLPRRLQEAGAFTVVSVVGPDGFEASRTVKAQNAEDSRVDNMWRFAGEALALLDDSVRGQQQSAPKSKL